MLSAQHFKVNLILPTAQAGLVAVGTYLTGRFFNHSVTVQTAALVSATAALVSAVSYKIMDKSHLVRYSINLAASSSVGVLAGWASQRALLPFASFTPQAALITGIALIASRAAWDSYKSRRPPRLYLKFPELD
ncbi:MAG: hypothetical protein LW832_03825 [Parachlamydia sp.]|nr:hypothetical protein [Parachlamydia sp.]